MQEAGNQRPGRRQLFIILAISAVSLFGSYGLFWIAKAGLFWGTTNNGQFVNPPLTTREIGWQLESDADLTKDNLWWIWLNVEQCGTTCVEALENLKSTHILLNREADRLRIGLSSSEQQTEALPQIADVSVRRKGIPKGVYVIDPLGNFVFFYPMDTPPKKILVDLKRLLKVSQIG